MAMASDAEFVNNVMASQPVISIEEKAIAVAESSRGSTDSSNQGIAEQGPSRKRSLSGDDEAVEAESNKKLKQQPSVSEKDVASDFAVMMKWMKQEFDGVKSDLTKTIDNRVDSLEEKRRNVMLTVVKEEVDKARKELNDRIDGMASKVET